MPASEQKPIYMREMMERLGIDPAGGVIAHSSLTYLTALHRCQTCPSPQACRDWLDSMPMSVSFAPRFCPNADILFELQVEQPRTDRAGGCVAATPTTSGQA